MKLSSVRPILSHPALCRRAVGCSRPFVKPRSALKSQRRSYALQGSAPPTLKVFNSHTKYLQKERVAANKEESRQVDYMRDEVATRLAERLLDINRNFSKVLDLGANACNLARILATPGLDPLHENAPPIGTRVSHLVCADSAPTLLNRDADLTFNKEISLERQTLDSLETLPYEANTFDAVLSNLSLHWINDLPSVLGQVNNILKSDAPFVAAIYGGDSLFELRTSLQLASMERRGGVSPHTSPLADVRDVGGLLTKAGFKMLTVDIDDIIIDYPDIFALMTDLQAMGESNAVLGREMGAISRDVLLAAQGIYKELHGEKEMGRDGVEVPREGIPATYRVIYMIGWKEGPNQSTPLERGSGQVNMKDILGGGEFRP